MIAITDLSGELQKIVAVKNKLRFMQFINEDPTVKVKFDELSVLLSKEGTTDSLSELLKFYKENEKLFNGWVYQIKEIQ